MKFFEKKTRVRHVFGYGYKIKGRQSLNYSSQVCWRINSILIFFILFAGLILFRLFKLQIIDGAYYYALASDQHEFFRQLYPLRGTIYFQERGLNGEIQETVAATNRELNLVYVEPKNIADPEAVLNALFEVLDFTDEIANYKKEIKFPMSLELTEEEAKAERERLEKLASQEAKELFQAKLLEKLSKKNDPYEPIKHRVPDDLVAKLKSYNLEGVRSAKEIVRYYPEKNLGSHVLGFVGYGNGNNLLKGYYGVEGNFNQLLTGESGFLRSELDIAGRQIAVGEKEFKKAKDGSSIVLTIDKSVEYYVCEQLFIGVKNNGADSGTIIVMNPKTGEIIAMCSYPDFDPNNYNKIKNVEVFNNAALLSAYEPGSVFKPITIAAAIDAGKITPYTTYEDKGEEKIAEYTIRNSDLKAHGIRTMTQVLEESLNTGTIFAVRQIGNEKFKEYVKNFGFGKKTGIEIGPEANGNIKTLDTGYEIYTATASFGQGITVTPIQLVKAYAAIANEGKLVQPRIVSAIIKPDGTREKIESKIIGQVISSQTAKLLSSMLVSVVQNGHAKKAQIPGYLIGGKTGTAQVPDIKKGGYSNQVIHTFVGFAPINDPQFVLLVKLDNVKKAPFAESTVVPMAGKIEKFLFDYYNIPPSE